MCPHNLSAHVVTFWPHPIRDDSAVCADVGHDGVRAIARGQLVVAALSQNRAWFGGNHTGYYLFILQAPDRRCSTWLMIMSALLCSLARCLWFPGGIRIHVKGEATPLANVIFFVYRRSHCEFFGHDRSVHAVDSSVDSVLNKYRVTAHHIVFFIFIVSNVGGCLTPIGDPPLFLELFARRSVLVGWRSIAGRCGRWASACCSRYFMWWTASISSVPAGNSRK